jgi:hypothetical protein
VTNSPSSIFTDTPWITDAAPYSFKTRSIVTDAIFSPLSKLELPDLRGSDGAGQRCRTRGGKSRNALRARPAAVIGENFDVAGVEEDTHLRRLGAGCEITRRRLAGAGIEDDCQALGIEFDPELEEDEPTGQETIICGGAFDACE